jgi:hypothetical protein
MNRRVNRIAASLAFASIAVAGCASLAGQDGVVTREGVPILSAGQAGTGMAPASSSRIMKLQPGDCDSRKCLVEIKVRGTSCASAPVITIDPPMLTLGVIGSRRIVWEFADSSSFEFCPSRGDGVFLQSRQRRQFENLSATSSEAGDEESIAENDCRDRFRAFNWNNDSNKYSYALQFSDKRGNTCKVDPWIKNGGSSLVQSVK